MKWLRGRTREPGSDGCVEASIGTSRLKASACPAAISPTLLGFSTATNGSGFGDGLAQMRLLSAALRHQDAQARRSIMLAPSGTLRVGLLLTRSGNSRSRS